MLSKEDLLKESFHHFFWVEKLSPEEQGSLKNLLPFEAQKDLSLEDAICLFNEAASFYSGEFAQQIKRFLFLNDLLAKDQARILRDQLLIFKKFFHHILDKSLEIEEELTVKRLKYVILKIDAYLNKYDPYLSL